MNEIAVSVNVCFVVNAINQLTRYMQFNLSFFLISFFKSVLKQKKVASFVIKIFMMHLLLRKFAWKYAAWLNPATINHVEVINSRFEWEWQFFWRSLSLDLIHFVQWIMRNAHHHIELRTFILPISIRTKIISRNTVCVCVKVKWICAQSKMTISNYGT